MAERAPGSSERSKAGLATDWVDGEGREVAESNTSHGAELCRGHGVGTKFAKKYDALTSDTPSDTETTRLRVILLLTFLTQGSGHSGCASSGNRNENHSVVCMRPSRSLRRSRTMTGQILSDTKSPGMVIPGPLREGREVSLVCCDFTPSSEPAGAPPVASSPWSGAPCLTWQRGLSGCVVGYFS